MKYSMQAGMTESDCKLIGKFEGSIRELGPVEIRLVDDKAHETLWNRVVSAYHYLGHERIPGRRLKYILYAGDRVIGAIGWKSGSLKLEARDCFIGWSVEQRQQHLDHVVNNNRFLIFQWLQVKNLASHVLGRAMKMVVVDWQNRYGVRPWVLETFIDGSRFRGSCYRGANWQLVGYTKGYGKQGKGYHYHGQKKEVYVYVVEPEYRRIIGCKRRSYSQKRSLIKEKRSKLRMVIQELGFNPELIDWAQIGPEMTEKMAVELVEFHDLFSDCFRRPEPRLIGMSYLMGLLSDLRRKTMEAIALAFEGETRVRSMQNFFSRYPWDDRRMLARCVELLAEEIEAENGMHTVDSTEIPKKGEESVGVARQYCGNRGKVENCQSGVFVGYTSAIGYGLVDRTLYMPELWFSEEYAERRSRCGVPPGVEFKSKIEIALELLDRQIQSGIFRSKWVGCDSAFGVNQMFRDRVASWGKYYLAAVPANTKVWIALPQESGASEQEEKRLQGFEVRQLSESPEREWDQVILGEGTKGPIVAEVSILRVRENRKGRPGPEAWLIIRALEGGKVRYYLSNAPESTPRVELCQALVMRWPIEQCFEDGKKYLGMDHYEHRNWRSWHRHMLYVFLALLFLLRLRLKYKKKLQP